MTRRGTRFGKKGREETFGGIDFGQGANYLVWTGNTAMTDFSNGTKVVEISGMGTLTSFVCTPRYSGATMVTVTVQGFTTNAGVTLQAHTGINGTTMAAKTSGATLYYVAFGTQA